MKADKYIGIIGGTIIIMAGLLLSAFKVFNFIVGVYLGFGACMIAFNKGIASEINGLDKKKEYPNTQIGLEGFSYYKENNEKKRGKNKK